MMRSIFSMNFKIKNNTLPGITRILRNMHHGGFPAQAMDLINPLMQNPSVHARQSSHHYHVSSVQVLQDISAFTQENIHSTLTVTFPNNEQSILLRVSMVLYMIEAVKIYFWINTQWYCQKATATGCFKHDTHGFSRSCVSHVFLKLANFPAMCLL